jgi:hypothetical protein
VKRRSSYKLTFFDKHGPEGGNHLKALGQSLFVFGLALPMFGVLGGGDPPALGLTGWRLIVFTLGGSLTLGGLSLFVAVKGGSLAGQGASHVYMGGASAPEDSFSVEQSLIMQRDYAGAAHLFEQRIIATPTDVRVLVAAADLYRTFAENPTRAAELYKSVQRLPEVASGHDVYVSNKLADLYLGPLKEPRRALVEFRRLIQRYPGSVTEKHARMALANLKTDVMKGDWDQPPEP